MAQPEPASIEQALRNLANLWTRNHRHPWKRKIHKSAHPQFVEAAERYRILPDATPAWFLAMTWIIVAAEAGDDDRLYEGLERAELALNGELTWDAGQAHARKWDELRARHQREEFQQELDRRLGQDHLHAIARSGDLFGGT